MRDATPACKKVSLLKIMVTSRREEVGEDGAPYHLFRVWGVLARDWEDERKAGIEERVPHARVIHLAWRFHTTTKSRIAGFSLSRYGADHGQ